MQWKSLIICVAALAGFATLNAQDPTASASASGSASTETGEHHGWHHHGFGFLLKKLNLTDAQKTQLKEYFSSNKATFKTDRLNLLKAEQAVRSAEEKNPSDEATIRSLSANVESAKTELTVQHAKFAAYLQSILTSAQKQTLTELQQKRDARMQEHINRLSQSGS
jgi:periplasmic protein CpxP/Spy